MLGLQISTSEVGIKILEASIRQQISITKYFISKCKENKSTSISQEAILIAENEIKEARIILNQIRNHKKMNK